METLDEGIRGLDDLDSFFDYLHQVGASHTRIPGFKAEYFWVSHSSSSFFFVRNRKYWEYDSSSVKLY